MSNRINTIMSHFNTSNINDNDIIISYARRTPIGSFQGTLSTLSAIELGTKVVSDIINQYPIIKNEVNELIFGNVVSAGLGQAPARQIAIKSGLPPTVCCTTLNKVCASGLKSISVAAQSLKLGEAQVSIAGGTESMSNIPYYMQKVRNGLRIGDSTVIDGMMFDGLQDPYQNCAMGVLTEGMVKRFNISRINQDEFTKNSYEKAINAPSSNEIVPITITTREGTNIISKDEELSKTSADKLSKLSTLKPAFDKNGSITAASSSKLSDGAAAVLLCTGASAKRLNLPFVARILGSADAELEPENFPIAPSVAIPLAVKRAGLTLADIDAFEINEAFACVPLVNAEILGIDIKKVNQFGGAVAIGHPLGCSGARIVVTCINVLRQTKKRYGCVSICNGGGGSTAMVIELLN